MDAVYKIILTDEFGDVSYAKRKSELGAWLAGINFDVVTRVDVELLDPAQASTPYVQYLLMDQGGPWTPLGVVADEGPIVDGQHRTEYEVDQTLLGYPDDNSDPNEGWK